jgi:hypothetical protein
MHKNRSNKLLEAVFSGFYLHKAILCAFVNFLAEREPLRFSQSGPTTHYVLRARDIFYIFAV